MAPPPAKIELILGTDPRRLLELAAAEFLVPTPATSDNPFPSPPVVLALRQGGIRDDLLALAHARGVTGWYDPPLFTFQELPKLLGQTDRLPLTDLDRRMLLGRLVRERATTVLGRLRHIERFISSVDRLVGELVGESVAPASFDRALGLRENRDDFERSRDSELAAIYTGYLDALAAANRRDGRDRWADCARAVEMDPEHLLKQLHGRRELRLFGLQDLKNGWQPLLRALQASPALDRITIYSAERLALAADLGCIVTPMEEPPSTATRLFTAGNRDGTTTVQVIAAPDVERELEEVAHRVRKLVDTGVPLHRIGVVARQARPHADIAASALERFGVPATIRRRHVLRDIPVVRALAALFAAAADGWSRHGLAELADQPYFASDLDATLINDLGYQRRIEGLSNWAEALRQADGQAMVVAFDAFAEGARELDARRTLADWLAWLHRFLADDPWQIRWRMEQVPGDRFDVVRLDLAGWKGLTSLVEEWMSAVEGWGAGGTALDVAAFHAQLDELLDFEVALWTPGRRGVPVLEGFAAAYRSFEHLFIVGLESGRFPIRAPGSPLLDDSERAALAAHGVPLELRAEWDRREQELFRVLAAGAEQLTVSYAALDTAGREVVRSSFIEALGDVATLSGAAEGEQIPPSRVLTPGVRICALEDVSYAEHAARIELERSSGRLSPWNGQIIDRDLRARLAREFGDDKLWSPTQLESYAKCPWAYFSDRLLNLKLLDDPDDEMDARTYGTVLHDALHRFYDAEVEHNEGSPVLLLTADRDAAIPRLRLAIRDAIAAAKDESWLGNPVLAEVKRTDIERVLTKYVEFEIDQNEKFFNNRSPRSQMVRTAVERHELSFREVVLERGGVTFRFRGSIDRVEVGVDERVASEHFVAAVDYKTSKYAAPGGGDKKAWGDGVVLQVPLYAYALSVLRPGVKVARVEYRALRQRKVVHSLQLMGVNRKTRELVPGVVEAEQMEAALDAVVRHVQRARGGEFPADPPPSCGCPSFCHARDICRVAGGPRDLWKR